MTKVGVLGATGAVGRQMLECIVERNIDVEEVRVFASERSKGKTINFKDQILIIDVANEENFKGLDYVLGAVGNAESKYYRPMIEKASAVYIDNSSAFRMEDGVPLVVPEINIEDAYANKGTIANPNCSTIIALMALAPINKLSKIISVNAATYQAVSGAGMGGISELSTQVESIRQGQEVEAKVFSQQIAYNCIAEIGSYLDNGYTTEEMKMMNEGRKIMHLPELKVTCTCVRVPVFRSHSIAITVVTEDKLDLDDVRESIKNYPGVVLMEDKVPSPLMTSNQDKVYVGRIRRDLINENGITLWCCGDQVRKGAAANAVEIMEELLNK